MRTKTQMAFFQSKNQISFRKKLEKLHKINDLNSNFIFKPSSKVFDISDIKTKSLEKRKVTKNISSKSEVTPKLNLYNERKETNKNIYNNN